jgi:hypothetical protein
MGGKRGGELSPDKPQGPIGVSGVEREPLIITTSSLRWNERP